MGSSGERLQRAPECCSMLPVTLAVTIAFLLALFALHLWWRARWRRARKAAADELSRFREAQEHAANCERARQLSIFNSMIDGVLVLDQKGRVQLANTAFGRLFNPSTGPVGKTLLEVLRWHELAELAASLDDANPSRIQELRFPAAGEMWLQVSAAQILSGDQQRHGIILVFHDVTRLKQLERTREEFVANVSHELRTPLSHIKGYVETLLSGAKDDPLVATRFLQTIERNAGRLQWLIDDLLTISELESGRVRLDLQAVALRATAAKVCEDFAARAAARKVTLENAVPDLTLHADSARIEQVLSNLVDNAIKYGREGGRVSIRAEFSAKQEVEVSVQDDGPGLPPEALERAFERFYRVDKARSREQGGTGLGLSIVKHIVQSHGGRVRVASQLGKGATFIFTLPDVAPRSPR
jgi:two-component system, OmpR family, phosphate regulon sensor histidine kinase PhoR